MDSRGFTIDDFYARLNVHIGVVGEINNLIEYTTAIHESDGVSCCLTSHCLVIGIVVYFLVIDRHGHRIGNLLEHNLRSRFSTFIRLDIDGNLLPPTITIGALASRHERIITSQGEIIIVIAIPSPIHMEHVGAGLIAIADEFVS